ncbi:porin family protein [Pseudopedobacter sp.]|uniref:porin family protein n=1 Tax=Pseudopedobacter sp. TaxID=1936787 RepID=UPI003342A57C
MIKKLLSLSVLVCLNVVVFAQTKKPLSIGLKGGLNGSFFTKDIEGLGTKSNSGSNDYERFFRISAFIGLTFDYAKTDRFILGTEVLYNARGMAYRKENNSVLIIGDNGTEQAYTYFKYNIDYLELPLKAGYTLSSSGSSMIYAGLAPAIAVHAMNATRYPKANAGPGSSPSDVTKDLKDVRTFNSSIITGLSLGGRNRSGALIYADLRFSYTLLPVFTRDRNSNGENLSTRMITGSFGAGIKF